MIRIVGSMMVIFAFSYCGLIISNNYLRRPKELRQMLSALNLLETEISYAVNSLPEAVENICYKANGIAFLFFDQMKNVLHNEKGCSAEDAWKDAVDSTYKFSALTEEDKDILCEFGSMLGTFGKEEQLRHLELLKRNLDMQEEKANYDAEKNSKLFKYFGFSTGLIIVILLV